MGVYSDGWCPKCGNVGPAYGGSGCLHGCPGTQPDRRLETLRRDVQTCDSHIEVARVNIEALEARKAEALAKIEKIENEPKDDWPNGTYLIAEDGDPTHTKFFFKDDNGDWRHVGSPNGNFRLTWSAVLQETEDLTVYQVLHMEET